MAFDTLTAVAATDVIDISAELFDPDPLGDEDQGITYNVQILFNDGSLQVKRGDLVPHITPAQISALQSFMASLRTQAENEFLP